MQQCRLEISKSGAPGSLVLGTGKSHNWHLESPVQWWPGGMSGHWARKVNGGKFSKFSYLELLSASGTPVARLPEQPYTVGDKFEGNLIDRWWFIENSGAPFDVKVKECPPARKKFRLWESWGGALSYWLLQGEVIGFEIMDLVTNLSANYVYRGIGVSIGWQDKRLPQTSGGISTKGPPNDFEAPGWMLAEDFEGDATLQAANVGLGLTYSKNCFDFAGHVDNFPGFWGHIPDLQTGRTIALPSGGFSSGAMSLLRANRPQSPR